MIRAYLVRLINSYYSNPAPFYVFLTVLLLALAIATTIGNLTGSIHAGVVGK